MFSYIIFIILLLSKFVDAQFLHIPTWGGGIGSIHTLIIVYLGYVLVMNKWFKQFNSNFYLRLGSKQNIFKYVLKKQAVFTGVYIILVTAVLWSSSLMYGEKIKFASIIQFVSLSYINLLLMAILLIGTKMRYGTLISHVIYFGILEINLLIDDFFVEIVQFGFFNLALIEKPKIEAIMAGMVGYGIFIGFFIYIFISLKRKDMIL